MSPKQIEAIATQELRALRWGVEEDERRRELARQPTYPGQRADAWIEADRIAAVLGHTCSERGCSRPARPRTAWCDPCYRARQLRLDCERRKGLR